VSRIAPRPLARPLAELTSRLAPATTLALVQQAWPRAVGPAIAAAAQPTAERDGVLSVSCTASVWAQEIDLMATELIASLNAVLGREAISGLRCRAL
jgi:predicted nucleic acid-binding Zn ribbon protein